MLTEEEQEQMSNIVATAVVAALQNGNCICNLSPEAQSELSHMMGMVKDIGNGKYANGIEVMRENNQIFTRFRARVDRLAQGIAWLIVASIVGGGIWLLSEGCKTAIKAVK
ncbi:MAG: hypothetical protein HGJ93_00740 [Desulfosarcina sp.]|nr:hypothetical protein [Desulfosarcina sp.]MBC2764513.1 hypothetical protein [Desulfosarcina sp.]